MAYDTERYAQARAEFESLSAELQGLEDQSADYGERLDGMQSELDALARTREATIEAIAAGKGKPEDLERQRKTRADLVARIEDLEQLADVVRRAIGAKSEQIVGREQTMAHERRSWLNERLQAIRTERVHSEGLSALLEGNRIRVALNKPAYPMGPFGDDPGSLSGFAEFVAGMLVAAGYDHTQGALPEGTPEALINDSIDSSVRYAATGR